MFKIHMWLLYKSSPFYNPILDPSSPILVAQPSHTANGFTDHGLHRLRRSSGSYRLHPLHHGILCLAHRLWLLQLHLPEKDGKIDRKVNGESWEWIRTLVSLVNGKKSGCYGRSSPDRWSHRDGNGTS